MKRILFCFIFITIVKSAVSKTELCNGKMCINKCCPDNYSVFGNKECAYDDNAKPFTNVEVYDANLTVISRLGDLFEIKPGFFSNVNRSTMMLHLRAYSNFYLTENGTMKMSRKGKIQEEEYTIHNYCLETRIFNNKTQTAMWFKMVQEDESSSPVIKYGLLISSICLLPVLIVYCLLPELRNLGGLILMMYVFSLMMAFLIYFCMLVASSDKWGCLTTTYLFYFFLMSCFCWMNVMSYDIWWTFRGYAKARAINRRGERFKFRVYSFLAWGIPLVMTIALSILNEISADKLPGIIKPQIPLEGCFLGGKTKLVYMYIPMLIMILFNWMFFGMTVFNIWRLSRGNKILTSGDSSASGTESSRRSQKQRFIVYLKLSVLMGLSWILEVISSFYPDFAGWYISDVYNALVGLIIFVIFICKKKVFKMLKKRFSNFNLSNFASSFQSRSRSSRSTTETMSQSLPLKQMSNQAV